MVQAPVRVPQDQFKCVGPLEDLDNIKAICWEFINKDNLGLKYCCTSDDEVQLTSDLMDLIENGADQAEWAKFKTKCVMMTGSHVALCANHMASAFRTPRIAESALSSASKELIESNLEKVKKQTIDFARSVFASVVDSTESTI
ncbi:MAG: hypothetical protein AAGA83_00410 [Cyanobacteria bacterium P01_F01_bin.116]